MGDVTPFRCGEAGYPCSMTVKAAITVNKPVSEVQERWRDPELRPEYVEASDAGVRFGAAPGDRGTEIHVELDAGGRLERLMQKVQPSDPRAKVMDDLRRFKQVVETGVVTRSEGQPEGERAETTVKPRPAQPLSEDELAKAGLR